MSTEPAGESNKPTRQPEKEPSFEQSLKELEGIVAQLEAGEKPLEESLALYEKGVAALKRCHALLDKAEKRIRLLVKGSDGQPVLREGEMPKPSKVGLPVEDDAATKVEETPSAQTEPRVSRKRPARPCVDAKPAPRKNGDTPANQHLPDSAPGAGGSLFGSTK